MKRRVEMFLVLLLTCCLLFSTGAIYAEPSASSISDVQEVISN